MKESALGYKDFIGLVVNNKKVAAVLFALGFFVGMVTTLLFNPFTPPAPTYSLCQKAGFPLRCRQGTACNAGETRLQFGLTASQCQAQGGTL